MNILAISGSLRAASSNTAILHAMAAMAPPNMSVTLYEGLGGLPHYSPELDGGEAPAAVRDLRERLRSADAVVICTPEYAHGMPGSLKNALDWLVSSGEFDGGKPAAALSASPSFQGGDKALAWVVQTLTVLGAAIPSGATLAIPFSRTRIDADGGVSDAATAASLGAVLDALTRAVEGRQEGGVQIANISRSLDEAAEGIEEGHGGAEEDIRADGLVDEFPGGPAPGGLGLRPAQAEAERSGSAALQPPAGGTHGPGPEDRGPRGPAQDQ